MQEDHGALHGGSLLRSCASDTRWQGDSLSGRNALRIRDGL